MKQIYHHYSLWEEWPAGLWRRIQDPDVDKALTVMRDVPAWIEGMRDVTRRWRYSCEQNLSHAGRNRVAWLGQAAVCLLTGEPSITTRAAWWQLTGEQQERANDGARLAIEEWEARNA